MSGSGVEHSHTHDSAFVRVQGHNNVLTVPIPAVNITVIRSAEDEVVREPGHSFYCRAVPVAFVCVFQMPIPGVEQVNVVVIVSREDRATDRIIDRACDGVFRGLEVRWTEL